MGVADWETDPRGRGHCEFHHMLSVVSDETVVCGTT
jgi:hypothetical protein